MNKAKEISAELFVFESPLVQFGNCMTTLDILLKNFQPFPAIKMSHENISLKCRMKMSYQNVYSKCLIKMSHQNALVF